MTLRSLGLWIACLFISTFAVQAQQPPSTLPRSRETIPALFVSDIHFDPFHDPAKARQLSDAPVSRWKAILSAPDSTAQPQAFAALQKSCGARGVDTPWPLLRSSLDAMRREAPAARFITVSGDLVVHGLPCRYQALLPGKSPAAYETFVEETMQFVIEQLRSAFPGVPVYVALGNNDTGCGDYHLDPDSTFLQATAHIIAAAVPAGDRASVEGQFRATGSYSVPLAPLRHTRLIVLNDLFLSPQYASCSGQRNPAPAQAELERLLRRLDEAAKAGDQVWVMAHIPPGVNAFETVRRFKNLCSGEPPESFLVPDDSARLGEILEEHGDTVRLALFGHTHMDEMRILVPGQDVMRKLGEIGQLTSGNRSDRLVLHNVPMKLVPSISPVDGNEPSFTVAHVHRDGTLQDYVVVAASDFTGTTWSKEYDFAETYQRPDFSSGSLFGLMEQFRQDPGAKNRASRAYIQHYFKGKASAALAPFWLQYECSLENLNPQDYTNCVCSQQKYH